MTSQHIGKQPDNKSKRLDENTQELYRYQDEFYTRRYSRWIKNMFPIMTIRIEKYNYKRNKTHYHCKGDIACYIGWTGNQSKYVIDKNKKENGCKTNLNFKTEASCLDERYFRCK